VKKFLIPFIVSISVLIPVVSLFSLCPDTLWTRTYGGIGIDVGGNRY
jgi:hypothetical protein